MNDQTTVSGDGIADVASPAIRFPEFRNKSGWRRQPLSALLTEAKHRNRSLVYGAQDVLSVSGEYGCVNQIAFMGRSYAGISVKDYHVVQPGDVVYTKSPLKAAPYGIIKANRGAAGIVSTLYAVYRPIQPVYSEFLDHYFSRYANLNAYLQPIVRKGAKNDMKVKNAAVLTGHLWVPEPEEAEKISACLGALDVLLDLERQRLIQLQSFKRGLLEEVFPTPEESVPSRRFPAFADAGEWERRPLGDLLQGNPAYGVNAPSVEYSPELPTYLRITDIAEDGRFLALNKTSVEVVPSAENTLQDGDLALARTGGSVGKAYLHKDGNGALVFAGFLIRIRPDPRQVLSEYIFQYMKTATYWDWVSRTSPRSGQPGLNGGEYASFIVPLPPAVGLDGLAEQRRIVDLLTSADRLIADQSDCLDTLKAHKAALIQSLYPDKEGLR
jgi:type I restriction enzyme S subunit